MQQCDHKLQIRACGVTLRLPGADLFHTGVAVADLAVAKVEFERLGFAWGFGSQTPPPERTETPVLFRNGPRLVRFHFAYSTEGPHRLELLQAIPGTIWEAMPGNAAHHLGYWSDDVVGTSALLEEAGCPWTAKIGVASDDESPRVVMHRSPSGLHIELLDRTLAPDFGFA
jgi:hypothetical protein